MIWKEHIKSRIGTARMIWLIVFQLYLVNGQTHAPLLSAQLQTLLSVVVRNEEMCFINNFTWADCIHLRTVLLLVQSHG
jgi:hypothetical protein